MMLPTLKALLAAMLLMAGSSIVVDGCSIRFSSKPEGELDLSITDAPVEYLEQVTIALTRVELRQSDGSTQRINTGPTNIDNLLELQGEASEQIVRRASLPAGDYDRLRLYFSNESGANRVVLRTGGEYPLLLPGQSLANLPEAYLEVRQNFSIPENERLRLTLDIDLLRGLVRPETAYYRLRPVLRLVDNSEVGVLYGDVVASRVDATDCDNDNAANDGRSIGNLVYLFSGHDATPGDIHLDQNGQPVGGDNPITVVPVRLDSLTGHYRYEAAFLPAGRYTLAFTCQGLSERPNAEDQIRFDRRYNVTVSAGQRTRRNVE